MIFKFGFSDNIVKGGVVIVLHLRLDSREKLKIKIENPFYYTFTEKLIPTTDIEGMWDVANEEGEYVFTALLKGEGRTVREVIRKFEIITIYGGSYISRFNGEVDISYRDLPDFIRKYGIIPRFYIDYD